MELLELDGARRYERGYREDIDVSSLQPWIAWEHAHYDCSTSAVSTSR